MSDKLNCDCPEFTRYVFDTSKYIVLRDGITRCSACLSQRVATNKAVTQSRAMSFVESVANVVIGYIVAILAQFAIFPLFGIHIPASEHLQIGLLFTLVSLVRSYVLRRFFNGVRS